MSVSNALATATAASLHPGSPQMLHHVTYVTYDSKATADFYTQVMGMPLVGTVMDDHLPSTGNTTPYFHTFFRLGDGSTIAFFESPGLPPMPALPDPAFDNFQHLALAVPSKDDVDAWKVWLEANGIDVQLVDHKIIYSIYFHDPNGVRLEVTTTVVESWQDEAGAASALQAWVDVKDSALELGDDVDDRRRALIANNAHQAQIRREREPGGAG
jgi:catechol 2,3-dioxygenase-like lactoylglutathione lyase family enzyme